MFDTVNGMAAHPLFIHIVVVLLPLSAIGMVALVVIPQFRGNVQKYFVAAGVLISLVGAFVAKQSGQALAEVRGVANEHQDWGNRTFYLAIALVVVSALWLWLDTKPKSVARTGTGIIVVIVSLAAIISTVLTGDSGAQQVWAESTQASAAATPSEVTTAESTVDSAITLAVVNQHSTADDCWSAISGSVYDLTQWISAHPGGSGPIESICGIDATQAFSDQHDGQGKPETNLAGFKIGPLG